MAGVQGLIDQTLLSNGTSGVGIKGGYETYSAGSFSSDGRFVAFDSDAADLVDGDKNGRRDIFVKDRLTGTTTLVSKNSISVPGNGDSSYASISADGRYVAFFSSASNLLYGETTYPVQIFVKDRQTGTITLVSRNTAGVQGIGTSLWPSLSSDSRYVAFQSSANNLVPGDFNGVYPDVFLRDLQTGTTTLLAPNITGGFGNIGTYVPTTISSDNQYVAFWATSTDMVSNDTNGYSDVFVRDLRANTTSIISVSPAGVQGNGRSEVPAISLDGRYVAFQSEATNLMAGDTNGRRDVFVRNLTAGTTELVSKSTAGVAGNGNSGTPAISADGRYVVFFSSASNLVAGDTNGWWDVFAHDQQTGTTSLISQSTAGVQGNANSLDAFISPDGRYVGFYSDASNLVANDTNGRRDVFVRDLVKGTTRSLTIPEPAPVADFTANITSGDSPLGVQFTDTSTGNPTSWNWSFGDGEYSEVQNPSHVYIIADSYDVSLIVEKEDGSDTETKPDYISVTCPYSCDTTITDPPYILFGIYTVSCPEDYITWREAKCIDNTLIRWAKAGQSSSFYTNLSPWLWKPSACCPGSGYSWAVDSPANLPIYYSAVTNEDTVHVHFHHHAVAAEYLGTGDPRYSGWQDWNFFNYHEKNIMLGPGNQTPNGTSISNTTVTINDILGVFGCGQPVEKPIVSFDIDMSNNIIAHPALSYAKGYIVNKTGKTLITKREIPVDLDIVMQPIHDNEQFTISKWEFNPASKEITLYVYNIRNSMEINDLQGKSINGYSIRVIHDLTFEKNIADIQQQLIQIRKDPDLKIAATSMIIDTLNDPPQNYVEIWVDEITPENEKMNNTMIQGWKIFVHPITPPSLEIKKPNTLFLTQGNSEKSIISREN